MSECFVCGEKKKTGRKIKIPGLYEVFVCKKCNNKETGITGQS